jgi:hypothetical protein
VVLLLLALLMAVVLSNLLGTRSSKLAGTGAGWGARANNDPRVAAAAMMVAVATGPDRDVA